MKNIFFLFFAILLNGCYSPEINVWDQLTIKEGSHRSHPYQFTWNDDTNEAYEWMFTESCEYDLGDSDQCDWNKLTGRSVNLFNNHENSLMVGWRWDLDGFWWVAPYYHQGGETFWSGAECSTPNAQALLVDPKLKSLKVFSPQKFETHFTVRADLGKMFVTIIVPSTGENSFFELDIPGDWGNTREIYPWFGGNETAPQDMTILRRLIAVE